MHVRQSVRETFAHTGVVAARLDAENMEAPREFSQRRRRLPRDAGQRASGHSHLEMWGHWH